MRLHVALALTAGLLSGADKAEKSAVQKEWARLEGTWTLTKMEANGKSLLQKGEKPATLVIKDGKVRARDAPKGGPEDFPAIRLDPTHTPRWLTLPNFKGGPANQGVTAIGIYERKGDTLRVCVQAVETARLKERAKERPKRFDSRQGLLLVFRRSRK